MPRNHGWRTARGCRCIAGKVLILLPWLGVPYLAAAQVPEPVPAQPTGIPGQLNRPLRVFLDCQTGCDSDYLVTEIGYVAFVRDRQLADVHVLVTALDAASGGEEFTLAFLGQPGFAALSDTIVTHTPPNATDDDERRELRRAMARGLFPFVSRTSVAGQLDIRFDGEPASEGQQVVSDPWNFWVFEAEVGGSADVEQRRRSWSTEGELRAQRITDRWKVETELEGEYETSEFELSGGRTASNTLVSYGVEALVVRSLGDHLSAGVAAAAAHSDFFNQRLAARVGPAVEYNFLDWDEATRQRVTLRYSLGVTHFDYLEETIFLRERETVVSQHAGVAGRLRQPWGSINASVLFGNIVNEPSRNILTVDAFGDVRLLAGLSVFAEVEASRVRNQLYLPRGDLTDEEILLGQRALATDYSLQVRVGLSYTFGSIYNTIVNPRFGDGIAIF